MRDRVHHAHSGRNGGYGSIAAVPAGRPTRLTVCCTLKPEAQILAPAKAPRPKSDVRSTKDLDRRPLHFVGAVDVSLGCSEVLVAGEFHDDLRADTAVRERADEKMATAVA